MKLDLAVIGQGAVSPAGVGVEALLYGKPVPGTAGELGQPQAQWPVLRADAKDPALVRWQREPRLRRASAVTYFLVEAAAQALANCDAEMRAQTGLIVAYSAGCLAYSQRFYQGIVMQGQRSASPALFPETVFNSPVSHVAAVLGLNGAAYALVGDESAWVSALMTAAVWLKQERVRQVLVLGAEEFESLVLDAYRSARWLRRGRTGIVASEGAAGVLVTHDANPALPRVAEACDGFIYRSRREAESAAAELLTPVDPTLPVYASAKHNWLGAIEAAALGNRPRLLELPYLGEAFTASAAWHTLRALAQIRGAQRAFLPVWGLNHQVAGLELQGAK
jgi:hypothetical protein